MTDVSGPDEGHPPKKRRAGAEDAERGPVATSAPATSTPLAAAMVAAAQRQQMTGTVCIPELNIMHAALHNK